MSSLSIISELKRISLENGGILKAEDVVDSAKSKSSPLHDLFTWDDSEAAHQYRLWQARTLIRVSVEIIDDGKKKLPVNVFVSLKPDREMKGGGYRTTIEVLGDKSMRKQLLKDALEDMERFKKKYIHLEELVEVFIAMNKVLQRRRCTAGSRLETMSPVRC